MDGSWNNAANAMTAMVARQFTPSRIERQLLAQAFELVYSRPCVMTESRATTPADAGTHGVSDDARGAGRRAA